MHDELGALEMNQTWELPNGKQPIGPKWVYKVKVKAYGSID